MNHGSALWLSRGRNAEDDGGQEKQPMTRKTGWPRSARGDKETEEKEEEEEKDEWARETRNEVKIDSAGETSGSVLC